MVWRSNGPQGQESQKVMYEIAHLMHGRCLDLGCGPTPAFALAPHVIGIDNDHDLKLFGAKANQRITASADKLDMFADGSIDVVFSSHLLEHVVDYGETLKEWWRVLCDGGRLILYVPHPDLYPNVGMPGANPDHRHDIRPEQAVAAMRAVAESTGTGWELERNETRAEENEYSWLQIYRKTERAGVCSVPSVHVVPKKRLGLVRLGAYGDALWISPIVRKYKEEGWHVVLFTQKEGEASLRADPNIDEFRVQPDMIFGPGGPETSRLQNEYWLWLEYRGGFDRFVNLVGSVERSILPHQIDPNFYLPTEVRRRVFNRNYVENVHFWAGVPFDPKTVRITFYPTPEEEAFAREKREEIHGPLVVINPSGSSVPKFWPHTQRALEILDAAGISTVVLGDTRNVRYVPPSPRCQIIGTKWTIRQAYAFARLADVVIGTESAIINSVAHEPPLKIVLLSHSTAENLTRDWARTIAVEPEGLHCYPCHRIHATPQFCSLAKSGAAACQEAATAEVVTKWAIDWVNGNLAEAA